MLRLVLGIVVGILAGMLTVAVGEMLSHQIYPPPPGADVATPEGVKALIDSAPRGALLAVGLGWGLATFVATAVALLIAKGRRLAGWIAAAVLAAASGATLVMIPHPAWFVAVAIALILAGAWLADRLFVARR